MKRVQSRPNILWMVADHQAYANRPALARSFALQARLAREGTRFTRAYTALPVCSPARASMLTGRYPHAHGLTENDGRFGGRPGLEPDDWLLHKPLAETGYRCAWFGKWHLDNARSALDYGFEGYSLPGYGYPYGTAAYRAYLKRAGLPAPVAEIELPGESGIAAGTRIDLCAAGAWFDFEAGAGRLDGPPECHEAYFLARLAADWLEGVGGEPFFLRIDPWGPHPPYLPAAPFHGMLDRGAVGLPLNLGSDLAGRPTHHRGYRDYWQDTLGLDAEGWRRMAARALEQVALVEAALAGLLDALDRLGLAENTLVIFTADHGDAVGSNGGVANKGGLMVEETMAIPLLLRGPGIAKAALRGQPVGNIDIAPTILAACGIEAETTLHGISLLDPAARRRGLMAEHYGLHQPILQRACYEGHWKLVVQEDGFAELYDLAVDPCETRNLAAGPEERPRLEGLWAGLLEAMDKTDDHGPRLAAIRSGPPAA